MATHPLVFVHVNYLCLEPRKGLEENVLVVTDHLTRYAQANVTRTKTSRPLPKPYGTNSWIIMGDPKKILSDQGRNFESKLVADL